MKKFFTLLCMALVSAVGFAQDAYDPSAHTAVVSGTGNLCSGNWTAEDQMTYDAASGLWKITLAAKDTKVIEFKVVYDGEWYGDEKGNNYQFQVSEASDVNITFDPNTLLSTYSGDKVVAYDPNKIDFVVVAGSDALLNGENWNVESTVNRMTEEDAGYYELKLTNVAAGNYEFKFAANGAWAKQWGAVEGQETLANGVATPVQGGANPGNLKLVLEKGATYEVVLTLDNMDPDAPTATATWTKTGEAAIEDDVYSLAGTFNGWNQKDESLELAKAGEGIYNITLPLQVGEHKFKVVLNHDWAVAYPAADYVLNLTEDADVTITLDLNNTENPVSVTTAACSVYFVTINVKTSKEAVNLFACQGASWENLTGGWPGTAMTKVDGGFTYSVKVTKGQTLQLIFNGEAVGDKSQTENIELGEITANATLEFTLNDDWTFTATGIQNIQTAQKSNAIYNLSGQRVEKAQRGIYVINGKKVVK